MSLIIVERELGEPSDLDSLQAREDAVAWCLEERGVTFLYTYFARDRSRMVCVYDAPDAESVRHTQRVAELPVSGVWAAHSLKGLDDIARRHDAGERTLVVVRREFPAELTQSVFEGLEEAGAWCFETNQIDVVDSYLHANRRETMCVFVAPDAESVRTVSRIMSMPCQVAWTATFHMAAGAAPPAGG